MKVEDRRIEWSWNGDTICDIINAVTSRPGAVATIEGVEYLVFGAKIERNLYQNSIAMVEPGTPLFSKDDAVLISTVQGNWGAGGCMLALVGDVVLSHHSVVFNPHYKLMALKGSEYWTYFLPQRVGHAAAEKLTALALPLSAAMAKSLGVVDEILGADTEEFRGRLRERVRGIANEPSLSARLLRKSRERSNLEWMRTTKRHRDYEMMEMLNNFESAEYHQKRHDFVHKVYAKTVVEWQQAQSLLALLNQWGCHGAAAAESLPRIAHSAEVAPAAECGAKAESG